MKRNQNNNFLNWDLIFKERNNVSTDHSCMDDEGTGNKGTVFEDLIEKLLVAMFPRETWRRTKKSHDGKRDFVYPENELLPDQKWAECKNYSSDVSLNIIAPTLVMGAIEKIRSILFFSYSPLNDNAIEGILRYSEFTGKDVKIFDGSLLKNLIYKYHSYPGIEDFFPNTDFSKGKEILNNKPLRIIKTLRTPNGDKLFPSHIFELGESFSINIIVQNLSLDIIDYVVSIKLTHHDILDFTNNGIFYSSLPGAAIKEYTIPCQALKPGSTSYTVKLLSKESRSVICEALGKIRIADEPYLFWTGKCALNAQKTALFHLANYLSAPLLIAAESGTGKSTLIDILLHNREILGKYNILKFDLNKSRNCCVRNILSQAIGVCGSDVTPKDQVDEDHLVLNLLINTYAESAETIAETIIRFYNPQKPYLIVIDDLQKIGRAYIDLINEIDTKFEKKKYPIYYLLALNEDVTSIDEILARLNWDAFYQNRVCEIIKLNRFYCDDIIAFLKHKFGLTNIDRFFNGFESGIRPIELHSFCTNLVLRDIVSPISASTKSRKLYQIVDELRFYEAVNTVLYANKSINAVWETLKTADILLYILKYLYIVDAIGLEFWKKYQRQIEYLVSLRIVKEANAQIVFVHDEIRRCAKDNLVFSEEDYADIYNDKNIDDASKAICVLNKIHRLRGGTAFLKEFFQSNQELTRTTQRDELFYLILENLDKLYETELTTDALHFVRFHFPTYNSEHGYISSFRFLRQVANAALSDIWATSEESVENMAYFIKKYFDRALSTRNYKDCLDYYPKFEALFQNISYISPQRRNYWLAHYTNRLAIMHDRGTAPTGVELPSAKSYYSQSNDYCTKAGSPVDLQFQICIDEFNRHYVYRHDLNSTLVAQTLNDLNLIKQNSAFSSSSLDYHLLLLEYVKGKMCTHEKPTEQFLVLIKSTREKIMSPFYKLKLYMLESYILIELDRLSDADALLSHAFELAYKSEMRQHIYKLTYISAYLKIFQSRGEVTESAYKQIVLAFEQLMHTRGEFPNDLKREIYLAIHLISLIVSRDPEKITHLAKQKSTEVQLLLNEIKERSSSLEPVDSLFSMQSYFVYHSINFPSI